MTRVNGKERRSSYEIPVGDTGTFSNWDITGFEIQKEDIGTPPLPGPLHSDYAPINWTLQHPPPPYPRARPGHIGSFQFLPLGSKMMFKCLTQSSDLSVICPSSRSIVVSSCLYNLKIINVLSTLCFSHMPLKIPHDLWRPFFVDCFSIYHTS